MICRLPRSLVMERSILSDDEVLLVSKTGTATSIEHNAAPIKDSTGKVKGVVIIFRDVTERHRAEQAQREARSGSANWLTTSAMCSGFTNLTVARLPT